LVSRTAPIITSVSIFTAGAGIEFVLAGPLTGKVEYLYVNHNGNNSADVNGQNCVVQCNGPVNFGPKENIVRVGLNYRLWAR
jgi:opacity protein-like surface antigen